MILIIGLAVLIFLVFCFLIWKIFPLKISILLILAIITLLVIFMLFKSNYFVESTNLKSETLSEISIGDEVTPLLISTLQKLYGDSVNDTGMAILTSTEHDNSLNYNKFFLGSKNNKVNILILENLTSETSKGIKIGEHIEKVKEVYGANYKFAYDEIGETITYFDKENKTLLKFVIYQDKVFQIQLTTSY